jgi:hypothetical protein
MIRSLALAAIALLGLFASGCYVRARPVRSATYTGTATVQATASAPQGVVVYQPPPAPRATVAVTARPPAPYSNAVWVDGHWQWNGAQYVWVDGHWVQGRAGHVYVQPRWERRGNGYVYVSGSWRRGAGRGSVTVRRPRTNVVVRQPARPRTRVRVGARRPRGRTTTTVVQQPNGGQTTVRSTTRPRSRGPVGTIRRRQNRRQNRHQNRRQNNTVRVQGSGSVSTMGGSGRATVRVR